MGLILEFTWLEGGGLYLNWVMWSLVVSFHGVLGVIRASLMKLDWREILCSAEDLLVLKFVALSVSFGAKYWWGIKCI